MIFVTPSQAEVAFISRLLSQNELPTEGIDALSQNFLVAIDDKGTPTACAGYERYLNIALLRSVAVLASARGTGIGQQIVAEILKKAKSDGIDEFVLLTTTAKNFFATKFGFEVTERERYDELLNGSFEWNLPQCSTAVAMRKDLTK